MSTVTQVWILQEYDFCEYQGLHGIFSTEQNAQDHQETLPDDCGEKYLIVPFPIDQPVRP